MKVGRIAKANLRVINWNGQSFAARGVLGVKAIYSVDVVCLQETRLGASDYSLEDFSAQHSRP